MLTMAHRLATMKTVCPVVTKERELVNICVAEAVRAVVGGAMNIIADSVASYYGEHPKQDWYVEQDFPNCAPPFPRLVFSWKCDGFWRNEDRGVVLLSELVDPSQVKEGGMVPSENIDVARACKWYMQAICFHAPSHGRFAGQPVWTGRIGNLFVDANGRPRVLGLMGDGAGTTVESTTDCIFATMLTLSFMHCKNISRKDVTDTVGPEKKWLRRQKCPEIKCYTLDIDPMKQVLRTEGGIETNGLKKALHICRGHFAHYTDENPLFGRITGTFWKPQHVRGSKEFGEVKKDYRIKV